MKTTQLNLSPGKLKLTEIRAFWRSHGSISLKKSFYQAIKAASKTVQQILAAKKTVYGINTGFGKLAHVSIDDKQLSTLQHNLILSHCTGVGEYLSDDIVRLILLLKINSLAQGFSGVRPEIIDALIKLLNKQIYPCIPAKGSVGASGDLAPLAHLSAVLLGVGEVRVNNKIISAKEGLKLAGLKTFTLAPKEGLALLNGTQVSTAIALAGYFALENVFAAAIIAGALSVDAAMGSDVPFDSRIHQVRGQTGQIKLANIYRKLLKGSKIRAAHKHCKRVQDPYSLRCQPQVMGACLDYLKFVGEKLLIEANAVTDNPLIFAKDYEVLSGGNFHAEPVALAADTLALCIAEIGNLSERRIALLIDPNTSELPAFLIRDAGLNSGFMIAHVTAAALASENRQLVHPASSDNIPTSANQEDHVSMATHGARRLLEMVDNCCNIIAIELLAACQGVELRKPLETSKVLQEAFKIVRNKVAFYREDRYMASDIASVKGLIQKGVFYVHSF